MRAALRPEQVGWGVLALFLALAAPLRPGNAHAQPTAPATVGTAAGAAGGITSNAPGVRLVMPGTRIDAPSFLLSPDDLAWFKQRIEELEYRLRSEVQLATDRCAVQVQLQQTIAQGERDRLGLVSAAYEAERDRLAEQLARAQREAAEARQRKWWERPGFWYGFGVFTSLVGVSVAALALH